MALLDELTSGLGVTLMPRIREELGLSYAQVGLLFTAGGLLAMLVGPLVGLLEGRGKRWPLTLGLTGLGAGFAVAATAHGYLALVLAFALTAIAGTSVSLAQTALVDATPREPERALTRWTLVAGLGDLAAPLLVAGALAVGLGWRPLHAIAAGLWLLLALVVLRLRFPAPGPASAGDESRPGFVARVREALGEPALLRWTAISTLCTLVDEVLLAFAALHLADVVGVDPPGVALAVVGLTAGPLVTLVALERSGARVTAERHLPWFALLTLFATAGFLGARSAASAAAWLALLGAGAAAWYPLAKARCYAALPGRTATVAAVSALAEPFKLAVPLVAGLVAQRFGPAAAVALLGVGGALGVLALVPRVRR